MYRVFIIITATLLICSCSFYESVSKGEPVAQVGGVALYKSDIQKILPVGVSKEDSTLLVNNYIESWAKRVLLLMKAEEQLPEKDKDVAKLLEDYRTQLLVFRYENMFVNERLDTVVSQKEREEYYNLHLKSYVTKNGIIKGRVINMHNSSPKINELERLLSKDDVNSIVEVEQLGYSSSYKYNNFNDEWVDLAVVAKEMGIVLSDLQKELAKKKTRYIKYKDSLNTSYLQTFEYVMAGEITPLEYNSESIKDIIISKRKKDLLQKLQSDIYKDALENKKIKIIENEKAD